MKCTVPILLLVALSAHADVSYTVSRKTTAGASVAGNSDLPSKYYFKGQKLKVESGTQALILDFVAQTVTSVDTKQKTFAVKTFGAVPNLPVGKIDVKESGRQKKIDNYSANEVILTMDLDSADLRQMGSKVQMEADLWLSSETPGAAELAAFYRKNLAQFPWSALSGAGNVAIQAGFSGIWRKIAEKGGVQVVAEIKVKPAPATSAPQLSAAESGRIRDTIAELDARVQRGGAGAEAATAELARLKTQVGDDFLAGGGPTGALFEITLESHDFSTGAIAPSVFVVPSGYRKLE